MDKLYIKDGLTVSVGTSFIYETTVYFITKNHCIMVNSETYESVVEIKNVVSYFRKSPYVVIYTDLVEAPLEWLLNNGYNEYYKPKKIKKVKQLKLKHG